MSLLTQIFGSRNQRLIKQYQKTVRDINALEPAMEKLSDAELQAKTPEFKERIAKGEKLDDILPEARIEDAPFRRAADRRHGAP
jgi:preprotein translocase subunit SecA